MSASRSDLAAWILPPCVVVLFVWLGLGGAQWNPHVPIAFSGDALFYLAQSKSTLDHGWWWSNPSLAVPSGYHALAFAQNTNVDQAIVWLVGRLAHEPALVVNLTWFVMLGLSAVTATWGLRRVGVSALGAGAAGVLFALSPFALYRQIPHLGLVTYLLPVPATVALLLASSRRDGVWRARDIAVPLAGCALLGLNFIYFAFFGAFIVGVGAAVGAARIRSAAPLRAGAWFLGVIMLTVSLNLIPNVLVWRQFGRPIGVQHAPAESEIYGLKIRHLVSPTFDHWFPPFQAWLAREKAADFPNENENMRARLGVVATAGFLGVLAVLIFPTAAADDDDRRRMRAASVLALAMVLLGTVGGFGTLFSVFISSEIRTYNRVSPFVAFFALAAVAMWVDRLTQSKPGRRRPALWLVILVVGLADQQTALQPIKKAAPGIERDFARASAFMSALEPQLPDHAMVFQLPVRPYPVDPGVEQLTVYAQFIPYLTSRRLRWSYPAMTPDQIKWERDAEKVEEADLPRHLAAEGFSAILISRAGYPDRGRRLQRVLEGALADASVIASSDEFVALDLRRVRPVPAPR